MHLRPLAAADLRSLAILLRAPTLARWWGPYSEDRLRREFLDDATVEAFAIETAGKLVGIADVCEQQDPDYRHAALDISIGEPYQSQGLGSDALRTLITVLVRSRGHHRLTVDPAAENLGAIRFYERLGFERVGIMRCYERSPEGGWRDGLLMEFVRRPGESGTHAPAHREEDQVDNRTGSSGPVGVPSLAAVCGLLCEACSIYIASHEDPDRLAVIAAGFGQSPEETHCDGCRAERRAVYCQSCRMFACATERGLAFCGECPDYPCAELEAFGRERPHRAYIHGDLQRIREIGAEAWMEEARRRYTCPSCGTINSAYDLACRRCGHEPGNAYVQEHREAIVKRLSELR